MLHQTVRCKNKFTILFGLGRLHHWTAMELNMKYDDGALHKISILLRRLVIEIRKLRNGFGRNLYVYIILISLSIIRCKEIYKRNWLSVNTDQSKWENIYLLIFGPADARIIEIVYRTDPVKHTHIHTEGHTHTNANTHTVHQVFQNIYLARHE